MSKYDPVLANSIGKMILAAVLLVFIGASILTVTWPSGSVAQFTSEPVRNDTL